MARWTPTNDEAPSKHHNHGRATMNKESVHRHKLLEEVAKFQKNMEELRLMQTVSNDLRNYRRMIRIKRND